MAMNNNTPQMLVVYILLSVVVLLTFYTALKQAAEKATPICHRIFATSDDAVMQCGASSGVGEIWGTLCFTSHKVTWDLTFRDGVAGHVPTSLFITGPTTEIAAHFGAFSTLHLIDFPDTDPLNGENQGRMRGTLTIDEAVAQHLVAKPGKFMFAALDNFPTGTVCDWASWIGSGTRA